jgi:hypothetical protein
LALTLNTTAVTANMNSHVRAVLDFQFAGSEFQPPVGDQTCLGYLSMVNTVYNSRKDLRNVTGTHPFTLEWFLLHVLCNELFIKLGKVAMVVVVR